MNALGIFKCRPREDSTYKKYQIKIHHTNLQSKNCIILRSFMKWIYGHQGRFWNSKLGRRKCSKLKTKKSYNALKDTLLDSYMYLNLLPFN